MMRIVSVLARLSAATLLGVMVFLSSGEVPLVSKRPLISSAYAVIGRPLTPMSYAGVGRAAPRVAPMEWAWLRPSSLCRPAPSSSLCLPAPRWWTSTAGFTRIADRIAV
jgi:hypothetical protein